MERYQTCKKCKDLARVAEKIAMFNGICWWKPCLKHRILGHLFGWQRFRFVQREQLQL